MGNPSKWERFFTGVGRTQWDFCGGRDTARIAYATEEHGKLVATAASVATFLFHYPLPLVAKAHSYALSRRYEESQQIPKLALLGAYIVDGAKVIALVSHPSLLVPLLTLTGIELGTASVISAFSAEKREADFWTGE